MSVVYFVQRENGDIKIGHSGMFNRRFRTLSAKYGDLKVLGVANGGRWHEIKIHNQFREHRISGTEFFAPTDELIKFINTNTSLDHADLEGIKKRPYKKESRRQAERIARKATITAHVSEAVKAEIQAIANELNVSVAEIIRDLVDAHLTKVRKLGRPQP